MKVYFSYFVYYLTSVFTGKYLPQFSYASLQANAMGL